MAQYFTPTFLNAAGQIVAALDPEDYGSGLKLMGHTRADAPLMSAVAAILSLDGALRVAWAGDYADNEPGRGTNLYFLIEDRHFVRFEGLVFPGVEPNRKTPRPSAVCDYICNLDKQQYIHIPSLGIDFDGWRRTPLPLLTAEYGAPQPDAPPNSVGTWARDRICYTQTPPSPGWTPAPPTAC